MGFEKAYRGVRDELWKRLREKASRDLDKYIYVCSGHSLGGALAVICSLDIYGHLELKREQLQVYTFGQPKVGNKMFAETIDSLIPV